MNPLNQFIEVAPDCPTKTAIVPQDKAGKRSIAAIEYELLSGKPYGYTLEELKFATHVQHKQIAPAELKAHRKQLWDEYFAKPCACMRASPLTKKYGWGAHYDENGKIALYAVESEEYQRFVKDSSMKKFSALRSKREVGSMNTYIALFRGINVGGNNMLPMKELVPVLENLGLQDIRTYIQSGNVVFGSKTGNIAQLSTRITTAIKKSHGIEPNVLLLDAAALDKAIKGNPYPEAETAPATLHFNFLASVPPKPDLAGIEKTKTASERYQLKGDVFYLHAPDGIGRSKLALNMERLLGVAATGRNWNTVRKLKEMAGSM